MSFFHLDKTAQTVVLFAALATASCQDGASDGTPAPRMAKPRIGYGLVNGWHLSPPDLLAEALDEARLGLTAIEWAPAWGSPRDPACSDGSTSKTYPAEAKAFVAAMRARGIETNIIVVNANGCAQRRQDDAYVRRAVEFIEHEIGHDLVSLTIVSEPWASPSLAEHWTRLGMSIWSGALVVPDAGQNHRTGRSYLGIPATLIDVHYCSDAELLRDLATPRAGTLHNTDCGPIINPGAARAAEFTLLAALGSPLLIYDFKGTSPDFATIAAMGEALASRGLDDRAVRTSQHRISP